MNCAPFLPLVFAFASQYGVEPDIAVKVMKAESGCRANAESKAGDLGLFQIRRGVSTAGFDSKTNEQLKTPRLNIKLGVRRLARAKRVCGGDPERWLSNYAGLRCGSSKYSRNVIYGRAPERTSGLSDAINTSRVQLPVGALTSERSGYIYVDTVDVSSERKR